MSAIEGFQFAARLDDLADPGRLVVEVADRTLVLVRVGADVFALDDVCTHDGGTLSDGPLEGTDLVCPRHGAKFDIRTGKPRAMPATRATVVHEVRIDDGGIYVKLNG